MINRFFRNKIITLLLVICGFANAQEKEKLIGTWDGTLNIEGFSLKIVIHISEEDTVLKGKLDSPDQGAFGLPADLVSLTGDKFRFELKNLGAVYNGKFFADSLKIVGSFEQGGMTIPLVLRKSKSESKGPNRPQEPKEPFPYNVEEVTFNNEEENFSLSGSLFIPKEGKKFPAVVVISGSGAQERDGLVFAHKTLLVQGDYLARQGFVVLRYDERGVGKSGGKFSGTTTDGFTKDCIAAVKYLSSRKDVDANKIGIMGHSEGGIIGPLAASQMKEVAFVVSIAGPTIAGKELLPIQIAALDSVMNYDKEKQEILLQFNKIIFELAATIEDTILLRDQLMETYNNFLSQLPAEKKKFLEMDSVDLERSMKMLFSPWMKRFLELNPLTALNKVEVPVLMLFGEKDLQVPAIPNLRALNEFLKKTNKKNITSIELKSLNHLMQKCETGSTMEYAKIEETISPDALEAIGNWLNKNVKK